MRIYLPNSAFLGNIDPFLRTIDVSDEARLEITANRNWISIHPMIISMIAALGLSIGHSKIELQKLEAKSKHYLERMGLFRMLGIKTGIKITEHEQSGRFIPLTQIQNSQELTEFVKDLIPLLHLEPKQSEPINYIITELVRNCLEHSGSDKGAVVAAQYYKKSNTIRIGIADTGVGIKETINRSHRAETHLDAIRLALMPGITGATRREGGTELNAGAGLFFIRSIAEANREFFVIYSGNAMYKLLKRTSSKHLILNSDPFKDRHSKAEDYPFWKGTVVGIDISLDSTKEFTELLEHIRQTYIKTIRERKKELFKRRPRFL